VRRKNENPGPRNNSSQGLDKTRQQRVEAGLIDVGVGAVDIEEEGERAVTEVELEVTARARGRRDPPEKGPARSHPEPPPHKTELHRQVVAPASMIDPNTHDVGLGVLGREKQNSVGIRRDSTEVGEFHLEVEIVGEHIRSR
jgi:hypothetical protein